MQFLHKWFKIAFDWLHKMGLTVLAIVLLAAPGLFAFWSAYESKRTADSVARMEMERLDYEKNRYTSEIYYKYVEFIASTGPIPGCLAALNGLEIGDLRSLLLEPYTFKYAKQNSKHVDLARCLPLADKNRITDNPGSWSVDNGVAVRHKILTWANHLDAMLLAFNNKVANQLMLCKNLSSWTMPQSDPKQSSQLKALFSKVRQENIWPGVPNLWEFIDRFAVPTGCDEYDPERKTITDGVDKKKISGETKLTKG